MYISVAVQRIHNINEKKKDVCFKNLLKECVNSKNLNTTDLGDRALSQKLLL